MDEYFASVEILQKSGVEVISFDKAHFPELGDHTPDSVFGNNWLSTDAEGNAYIHPMKCEVRQHETKQFPMVFEILREKGYFINHIIDLSYHSFVGKYLESTGAMIIDRVNNVVYAGLSQRCDESMLEYFASLSGYELCTFETNSSINKPFYHTNIIMCLANNYALVCLEAIKTREDRSKIIEKIENSERKVIEISLKQAEEFYCGNALELDTSLGERVLVMSDRAFSGLNKMQVNNIERHSKIVKLPLDVIEKVGGGSARCMLTENFLPRADE